LIDFVMFKNSHKIIKKYARTQYARAHFYANYLF